jgi:hypothetical protein
MAEEIAELSRATAGQLAVKYGPNVVIDVERALASGDTGRRPDQYADPTALGGFIVSTATLAWTIYSDLRSRKVRDVVGQTEAAIRIELDLSTEIDATTREEVIAALVQRLQGSPAS